ncbi:hypothetical protein CC86DRAFT_65688 [Ophiobolus disseminans]|uniref:Uncharacterized protein n=1 Tax=Ophiobolus disseminans TaxID=1469910 RepID=A0A6A6ZQA9_9PLEO|nr:hypothetical protein CC86DRAFT_65688 [Ophiobolus disseminans]
MSCRNSEISNPPSGLRYNNLYSTSLGFILPWRMRVYRMVPRPLSCSHHKHTRPISSLLSGVSYIRPRDTCTYTFWTRSYLLLTLVTSHCIYQEIACALWSQMAPWTGYLILCACGLGYKPLDVFLSDAMNYALGYMFLAPEIPPADAGFNPRNLL